MRVNQNQKGNKFCKNRFFFRFVLIIRKLETDRQVGQLTEKATSKRKYIPATKLYTKMMVVKTFFFCLIELVIIIVESAAEKNYN